MVTACLFVISGESIHGGKDSHGCRLVTICVNVLQHSSRPCTRREAPPLLAVVITKVLQVATVFWAYQVLQHLPLAVFLLTIKAR